MNDPRDTHKQQPGEGQPSQEELRAQLEEQLRQVRVQDLLVESAASIINLSVRRIAKEDERDLEQARVGIEAVRAIAGLLEGDVAEQINAALSEVQLLFAREARGGEEPEEGQRKPPQAPGKPPGAPAEPQQPPRRPQGGQPPPRLWTPGRD